MNKKIVNDLNMATTPMLQSIRPPDTLDIGGDIEKFIEESEKLFELTQTSEEHRGIFIKAILSLEATRKFDETEVDCDYKKRIQTAFSKPSNLDNDLNAALRYRRGGDSMTEFVRRIKTLTKVSYAII